MAKETDPDDVLDLDAYLARIGYSSELTPSVDALRGLHLAHATTIPFENLDILLGRPIELDLASLQAKFVTRRRGGYCFEQNSLFAAVLEAIGFSVTRLAARVRMGTDHIRPRSHMLLAVETDDGAQWLADVGFGGDGLLVPILLHQREPGEQFGRVFRVEDQRSIQVLQTLRPEGWFDLYAFTHEPQYPVDYVVANHYTSTHPDSIFVKVLVAQRMTTESRWVLRDRELTEFGREGATTRIVANDDALLAELASIFGLHFPAGTRFRCR